MATWKVESYDNADVLQHTIYPQNLHFAWRHRESSMIEFDIAKAALDPVTQQKIVHHQFIKPYSTHWKLYRDNLLLLTGWYTGLSGTLRGESVHVAGRDWLDYLDKRIFPWNAQEEYSIKFYYPDTDPGKGGVWLQVDPIVPINWILQTTLSRQYSVSFFWSQDEIGLLIDFIHQYGDTSSILSYIEAMASTYPGFEYDITPSRTLRFYNGVKYPIYNSVPVPVWQFIGYDDGLIDLGLTNNGIEATHISLNAPAPESGGGLTRSYQNGLEQYYRIDKAVNIDIKTSGIDDKTDIILAAEERGLAELARALNPRHEVPITVNPEEIPSFWQIFEPGLAVSIIADLEWHELNPSYAQIMEIDCKVDNSANEQVQLNVAPITGEPGSNFTGFNEA